MLLANNSRKCNVFDCVLDSNISTIDHTRESSKANRDTFILSSGNDERLRLNFSV